MRYLSTQAVAGLMDVTETTVKRWADEGRILCHRTLGGHRKFRMSDVVQFAEQHDYPLQGTVATPLPRRRGEVLELAVQRHDFESITRLFLAVLARADREAVHGMLSYLGQHRFTLAMIADAVVRPAMARIGEQWKNGSLEITQEHLISNILLESLIQLRGELHRKPVNGLSAVCACAEGNLHDLGLRLLAYTLETEGFRVRYLGTNTPAETLASLVRNTSPDVVCASVSSPVHSEEWVNAVGKSARASHAVYLVGGSLVTSQYPGGVACDLSGASVVEAVGYLRTHYQLKPGPRTRGRQPKRRRPR
jgi:excisionase family DNA binding protein